MSVCVRCGHVLGVGRFCTNCGHPVDAAAPTPAADPTAWRTDTAERPAVPAEPEPARYPLYADETGGALATGTHRAVTSRRLLWPFWVAGLLALVLVAGLGTVLLLGGDEDPGTAADPAPSSGSPAGDTTSSGQSPAQTQGQKTEEPTEQPSAPPEATDVARAASVEVPATAPPNEDTEGNLVRYEGRNLLDGVPETTWRMPGDGSGETIVLTLDAPTTVTSLGLVNGYAKTSGRFDWYAGNRRVLAVVWELDDGTTFSQDLEETRGLQTIEVPEQETSSVRLTLVEVSAPGRGPSRRDYTAISEISVVGSPAA